MKVRSSKIEIPNPITKQVIVVRKDLKMKKGKIGAQVAHASLGAILQQLKISGSKVSATTVDEATAHWLEHSFTKICLGCETEKELLDLQKAAKKIGLKTCLITDAGKTEFNNIPTITCLAIGPAWEIDVDEVTGHLKLL